MRCSTFAKTDRPSMVIVRGRGRLLLVLTFRPKQSFTALGFQQMDKASVDEITKHKPAILTLKLSPLQVEGGITTLLTRQATALSATGISSLINSMWLNGMVMPSHGQLASYQARIGYGLQTEMQRLQVSQTSLPKY